MRNSVRFMVAIILILVALCICIAINDQACVGATTHAHCVD